MLVDRIRTLEEDARAYMGRVAALEQLVRRPCFFPLREKRLCGYSSHP